MREAETKINDNERIEQLEMSECGTFEWVGTRKEQVNHVQ